nr:hypothetical protein [Bradyrhizobium sp. AUGA SZCCT0160]
MIDITVAIRVHWPRKIDKPARREAANRPSGWNTWLTFSISPMAPTSTVAPTRRIATK